MALKIFLSTPANLGDFRTDGEEFTKDFIRAGVWVLDTPNGRKKFPVTADRIKNWEKTYKLMRERGVTVPLTVDHVEVRDPQTGELVKRKLKPGQADAQRGFVTGLFANGELGECRVRPADEESQKLLKRCPEVSLELTQDFIDGHGNYYPEGITAITLTPKPVIPGQRLRWEKIAASREIPDVDANAVVCLSAEPLTATDPATAIPASESHMDLALLRKLLGLPETATEDDIKVKLSRVVTDKMVLVTPADAAKITEHATQGDRIIALSREKETLAQELAKKAGMPEVDEDAADMARRGYKARIDALGVKATPAQKTLLSKVICGEESASPNVVMLSRKAAKHVGLPAPLADTILEVFEAGDPAEMARLLTDQSKGQRKVELSRSESDPNGGTGDFDPKVQERMISRVNGAKDNTFSM